MAVRSWTIGSDPQCDLWINEASVSRRHCRLLFDGTGHFVEDLASRNGTFVGNQRIVTRTALAPGTMIRLSQQVPVPWPFENLAQQVVRVGRHSSNDVVLDHDSVSSNHALLLRDPNGLWVVQDLNSTNGTSIGQPGVAIKAARVEARQVIQFGEKPIMLEQLLQQAGNAGVVRTAPDALSNQVPTQSESKKDNQSTTVTGEIVSQLETFPLLPRIITMVSLCGLALLVLITLVMGGMRLFGDNEASTTQPGTLEESVDDSSNTIDEDIGPSSTSNGPAAPETQPTQTAGSGPEAIPPVAPEPPKVVPATSVTPEQRTAAIRDQTYWVTVSQQDDRFRIGSAIAIDARHLITSGKVIENLQVQEDGTVLEIWHPASGQRFPVERTQLHPERKPNVDRYAQGIESIRKMLEENPGARDQPEFKKLAESIVIARDLKRVYNVGAITIATDLEIALNRDELLRPGTQRIIPQRKMKLSGPAFDAEDPLVQAGQPAGFQQLDVQPISLLGKVTEQMEQLWHTQVNRNKIDGFTWEGCPVVDRDGHVSGLFAELPAVQPEIQGTQAASSSIFFDMISVNVLAEMQKILRSANNGDSAT